MMPGKRYMLDGITEIVILKSFNRSLSRVLVEFPDGVMQLVEQSRLLPFRMLKYQKILS